MSLLHILFLSLGHPAISVGDPPDPWSPGIPQQQQSFPAPHLCWCFWCYGSFLSYSVSLWLAFLSPFLFPLVCSDLWSVFFSLQAIIFQPYSLQPNNHLWWHPAEFSGSSGVICTVAWAVIPIVLSFPWPVSHPAFKACHSCFSELFPAALNLLRLLLLFEDLCGRIGRNKNVFPGKTWLPVLYVVDWLLW